MAAVGPGRVADPLATGRQPGDDLPAGRGDAAAWLLGPLSDLIGIPQNGFAVNTDDWDGYNADREHLVNFLRGHHLSNVVFITGDIHSSWANELTTRSTVLSPTGVEFVVPSVTSDNVDDFLHVPPDTVSLLGVAAIRAANPHVKWAELDQHGYGVLDVDADRCHMDWFFLSDRTKVDSGVGSPRRSPSATGWPGCATSPRR